MRKTFKITFFFSLALVVLLGGSFVLSFVLPPDALDAFSGLSDQSACIGIIGGADGPTAVLITRTLIFESPLFWVLCTAVVLVVLSAVGWTVTSKK